MISLISLVSLLVLCNLPRLQSATDAATDDAVWGGVLDKLGGQSSGDSTGAGLDDALVDAWGALRARSILDDETRVSRAVAHTLGLHAAAARLAARTRLTRSRAAGKEDRAEWLASIAALPLCEVTCDTVANEAASATRAAG